MEITSWQRQTVGKPLFEDLLWSRPENKRQAGKLLIVGGNSHGFSAPAVAYNSALKAGIGTARVILPDATKQMIGKMFPEAEFAPSTPSGSFSQKALATILDSSAWADAILLAGDFGRNSETAIVLEKVIQKYQGQVTIAQDGVDYFLNSKSQVLERENTLVVINLGKLQKLTKLNRPEKVIKHSMTLAELANIFSEWTKEDKCSFITKHADNLLVADRGSVSTTPSNEQANWQVELAAYGAVWWLQQPKRGFDAMTTAAWQYQSA